MPAPPTPESIGASSVESLQPLSELLRSAAIHLDDAARLWRAECANPRPVPPADIVEQGRQAVRAAQDILRQAETLLTGAE